MNDNIPASADRVSARRRLLRGSFAAPVALTLFSGGVAARSIVNCVTRQNAAGQAEEPVLTNNENTVLSTQSGTPGAWVRVQLRKFQGKANFGGTFSTDYRTLSNRQSRWIRGSDVNALRVLPGGSSYLSDSQWQLYDRDTTGVNTNCFSTAQFNPASAYANTAVGTIINSTPTESSGGIGIACGTTGLSMRIFDIHSTGTGDKWVALRIDATGAIVGAVIPGGPGSASAINQSCWTSFKVG